MKTPEDFAQIINDRKANQTWKSKQRKPIAIIATVIFSAFFLAMDVFGILRTAATAGQALQYHGFSIPWTARLLLQLATTGLALATIIACLKRPRWGRIMSMLFAIYFSFILAIALVFPNPHPLLPIAPGAEQAGADAARIVMAFGILAYVWSMTMGSKARTYFAKT